MKTIKLSSIKPNPDNPRVMKDAQFRKLVANIKRYPHFLEKRGIVHADGIILGGNMRYRAIKDALQDEQFRQAIGITGKGEIPATWVQDASAWSTEDRQAFIILDNAPAGVSGEWDWDLLANQYETDALNEWGLEVPEEEGGESGNEGDAEPQIDKAEELNDKWQVKTGDLWKIGDHRLLCGDSTKADDVARLMGGSKADMLLTDPPYGVSYIGKTKDALKVENDTLDEARLSVLIKDAFDLAQEHSRGGAYWYATVPAGPLHLLFASDWKQRGILRQIIVWVKDSMVLGHSEYHYRHEPILFGWTPGERHKNKDRTRTTVWEHDRPKASREHPTMKPVSLWSQAIKDGSRKGEAVYDPFLGSGTTMVAAQNLNRKCYGIEISPAYCAVILQRMMDAFPDIEIRRCDSDLGAPL